MKILLTRRRGRRGRRRRRVAKARSLKPVRNFLDSSYFFFHWSKVAENSHFYFTFSFAFFNPTFGFFFLFPFFSQAKFSIKLLNLVKLKSSFECFFRVRTCGKYFWIRFYLIIWWILFVISWHKSQLSVHRINYFILYFFCLVLFMQQVLAFSSLDSDWGEVNFLYFHFWKIIRLKLLIMISFQKKKLWMIENWIWCLTKLWITSIFNV